MKLNLYLLTIASCFIFIGYIPNILTQDAPLFGVSPVIAEQQINRVPYSPLILKDVLSITAYSADILANQFVAVPLPAGWPFTVIGGISTVYYGGAFANGIFYACTYNPNNLVTINITTGEVVVVGALVGTTGRVPTSMAYKQPAGPMYLGAPSFALSSCNLYTINLTTGVCTLVAPIINASGLMCMSINCEGVCYGIDIVNDNFVLINLNTGVGTIIGPIGVNSNFPQGMACDLSTGAFYWATYSTHGEIRRFGGGLPDTVINLPSGHELVAFGIQGTCPVGIINNRNDIPSEYGLKQNYPNPFNPSTMIRYDLPKDGDVKLTVFDLLGREVKVLVNEYKHAGSYDVAFDASGLSSGLYFYRLEAGSFTDTKKIIIVK